MNKPNLFLIGAMKSGTKYLIRLLGSHPSVFMCHPEEPSYFVEPGDLKKLWPEMWHNGYWKSELHYLKLFRSAGAARWIGEGSTAYTKLPLIGGVAERIAAYSPDSRFIYLMRDPVKRALSHYWWNVRFHGETRDPLNALRSDSQYCDYSYYAMQLAPYAERFGRERIALVTHEELTARPKRTLERLYGWLGVDASFVPADLYRPENVTPAQVEKARGAGLLHRIRHSRLWARMSPVFPRSALRFAHRLAYKDIDRRSIDEAAAMDYLRSHQREQARELSLKFKCTFPEWTTLFNCPTGKAEQE